LKEEGIKAKVIRLEPYKEKIYKSYLIKQKLKKKEFDMSKKLESEMKKLKAEVEKDKNRQELEESTENQYFTEEKEAAEPRIDKEATDPAGQRSNRAAIENGASDPADHSKISEVRSKDNINVDNEAEKHAKNKDKTNESKEGAIKTKKSKI
jgi:hypothetical protein